MNKETEITTNRMRGNLGGADYRDAIDQEGSAILAEA